MASPREMRDALAGSRLVEVFNKHGFETSYAASKAEALEKALSYIDREKDLVAWGGCHSAEECGLLEALRDGTYRILDRSTAKTPEEKVEFSRQALLSDVYIGGANALSATGELVNIDGNGNRVAAMSYGPKTVIVIAGMNKVMPDLDSAFKRARGVASPINCQRFGLDTPCSKLGLCADCNSPDRICNNFQVIVRCKPVGRIKLILVGDDLGY